MDVGWWLLVVLAQVTQGIFDTEVTKAPRDIVVTLNTLRRISQTSDKFLGISISPKQLLNNGDYSIATVNMLQALSPGYLRVGGPGCDNLSFKTLSNSSDAYLLTEAQWEGVNQLAADTGLHLVFSLSPKSHTLGELLRFSDTRGYAITWQLGHYKRKLNGTNLFSKEAAMEVSNLHRLVDSFPRYQNTAVLSPDLEFCEDSKCLEALKDFLRKTSDDFDAVILQMKPQDSIKSISNMFEQLDKHSSEMLKLTLNKADVFPTNKISLKKNVWVAEGENAQSTAEMTEAMSCAMYLGLSSQLGYHTVLLRFPHLSQPSPSYWTVLLYRALVGRAVLGTRKYPQATNDVAVFAACTETEPHTALDTEWEYAPGAVTMWGVNSAVESTRISLRAGWRVDHVHLYVVTYDDSGSILLNGQPLRMVHGVLPRFSPHIRALTHTRGMTVTMPPQSVFFIVLPDAQSPACLINAGERLINPLKNEDLTPLVLNIPITQTKSTTNSWNIGTKPNNIFIEKGGIFTDGNEGGNGFSNDQRTKDEDKNNAKENQHYSFNSTDKFSAPKLEQSKTNISGKVDLNQLPDYSVSSSLKTSPILIYNKENNNTMLNSGKSNEEFMRDRSFLLTAAQNKIEKFPKDNDKEINLSSNGLMQQSKSYQMMKNGYDVSSDSDDKISKLSQSIETKVLREKRSPDYGYYDQNRVTDTETSPLYRRVNMLKRILQKIQQPTKYGVGYEQQGLRELPSTTRTMHDKNIENNGKIRQTSSDYPIGISSSNTKEIMKGQTPKVEQNEEEGNINYLPGEFYEVLGELKIDSNVSLKDKEEITDNTGSLPRQQKCNNEESTLTVTKKPQNDPQEDRQLIENATENSKKYYLLKYNTAEQQMKTEKVEDFENKRLINQKVRFSRTMSDEDMNINNNQMKMHQEDIFQDIKKDENDNSSQKIKLSVKRTKRKIEEEKYINKPLNLIQENEESNDRSDYSDEVELRRFLEELTDEGEKLLQTIDEEYDENSTHLTDTLTTEPGSVLDKEKRVFTNDMFHAQNKTDVSDYYLKNNILIDNEVKPKRTYPSFHAESKVNSSLDKITSTATKYNMDSKIKSSTTSGPDVGSLESKDYPLENEPTLSTEQTTSKDSDDSYTKTNVSGKSITEGIGNSDMFIDSITLDNDKTTKPGINMTFNSNLETYSTNSLSDITDNTTAEFKSQNSVDTNEFSEINEGITEATPEVRRVSKKFPSATSNEFKSENDNIERNVQSVLVEKIAYPVTNTESVSFKDTQNSDDILGSMKKNDTNSNSSELIKNVDSNNSYQEVTSLIYNKDNPVKNTVPIEISGVINNIKENIADKMRKINSESKLENKVLPPPSKPSSILRPLPVPPILTLNRNLTLSKKINDINNRILALNSKPTPLVPVLGKGSPLSTLLDSRQERLEAIKQKLQEARERLLNITSLRTTHNSLIKKPLKQKREITMTKDMLNGLLNGVNKNKLEVKSQTENLFSTSHNKAPLENLYPIRRLKREVYNSEEISSRALENNYDQMESREAEEKGHFKKQASTNINIPYYFPGIKKWIIPLGNKTEQIFFKGKLVPVNLYGIVSNQWAEENFERKLSSETTRQSRALRYPCVKDKFNDFEAEDESIKLPRSSHVENKTITPDHNSQPTNAQPLTDSTKTLNGVILSKMRPTRSRRAVNRDIEMNEMEMKALLTNEIVKEKPTNYEPDHENVFSSMLHKTLTKTMTNKTGIERMLELAKQYQETNPSSIEIFSTKNMKTKLKKGMNKEIFDTTSEKNSAEMMDAKNIDDTSTISRKNQTFTTRKIVRNDIEKYFAVTSSSLTENNSTDHEQSTESLEGDKKRADDPWSDFISKIQEFFEDVTSVIKKGIM